MRFNNMELNDNLASKVIALKEATENIVKQNRNKLIDEKGKKKSVRSKQMQCPCIERQE